ncbi:MAG: DUF2202 domain-containing protein [Microcoleus sp.]
MQTVNSLGNVNSSLDATETEGLIYIREEEKLAHDVYVTLYQQWGLSTFNNIANSENRHENKIETLLNSYQISDSVGDNPVGVFVNPDLQQLYNDLVAQGSQSLTEALKVGVLIEETDIADLQTRIAQTDNADIQQVYEQLLSGSNNHLSAFASNLTGETGNTNSCNCTTNQIHGTTTDDTLTGGRSNQRLVGNCGGDLLTGELGIDYVVRGAKSRYGADFGLDSPGQLSNCQVQVFEQNYRNLDQNFAAQNLPIGSCNAGRSSNLSTNNLGTGFSANQNQIGTLNMRPTNDCNTQGLICVNS